MVVEAAFWEKAEEENVRCRLCPRECAVPPGGKGFCLTRENRRGSLVALNYALVSALAMDPVEKKPLYHFAPGSQILSAGSFGCNLACRFCQNHSISRHAPPEVPVREIPPEELVRLAVEHRSVGVAYTYNEPTVWFEYVRDAARLVKDAGLANVLVTNGWINPEPLRELLPLIDAANVDVKAFNDSFYPELTGGRLDEVLRTAAAMKEAGVHVETTTLLIPGLNDSTEEIERMGEWIAENLGEDTPVHVSAYHPSYRLDIPPTPLETLRNARRALKRRLPFVYMGNVLSEEGSDTLCRSCGTLLVRRRGFDVVLENVTGDLKCASCGAANNLRPFKGP